MKLFVTMQCTQHRYSMFDRSLRDNDTCAVIQEIFRECEICYMKQKMKNQNTVNASVLHTLQIGMINPKQAGLQGSEGQRVKGSVHPNSPPKAQLPWCWDTLRLFWCQPHLYFFFSNGLHRLSILPMSFCQQWSSGCKEPFKLFSCWLKKCAT